MCLEPKYFEGAAKRKFWRDINGGTPEEAKEHLSYYFSTCEPIAAEMAEWLNENWSKRDIAIKLGDEYLEIVEAIMRGDSGLQPQILSDYT